MPIQSETIWAGFLQQLVLNAFPEFRRPVLVHQSIRAPNPSARRHCDRMLTVLRGSGNYDGLLNEPLAADLLRASAYKYCGLVATLKKSHQLLNGLFVNQMNKRRVLNEKAMMDGLKQALLNSTSFFSLGFEGISVVEQVQMFAFADIIIAPHGGALANMIFMLPHSHVIEFFPSHWISKRYQKLAANLELSYQFFMAEKDQSPGCAENEFSNECKIARRDTDFVINVPSLVERMKHIPEMIRQAKYGHQAKTQSLRSSN